MEDRQNYPGYPENVNVFRCFAGNPQELKGPNAQATVPEGYSLVSRQMIFPDGKFKDIFYSLHSKHKPNPLVVSQQQEGIVTAFRYILTADVYQSDKGDEVAFNDDARIEEVGNIIGYAYSRGLNGRQILLCYIDALHKEGYRWSLENDCLEKANLP